MEITTRCPSCAKSYRVPQAAAGKSFACKQCGTPIAPLRYKPTPSDAQGDRF